MVTAITRGSQEKRIDFGYSFTRQHSICSCLLLYVQGNFTDTPVSKYVCQSQTMRQPFKPLLSHSFTPEPYTGFWVLPTFASPAICHFDSITKPSLLASLSLTMWNGWECEQHSLDAPQKMCVCLCTLLAIESLRICWFYKISVYKSLFSHFWPCNLQHVYQCV